MPMPPPPDLSRLSLAEIAMAARDQRLPPVEQWNPAHCGDSEMRIARDGRWYHQGVLIARPEMVRLFSTILRRERDGSHVLVTPAERLDIAVDDAPFVATAVRIVGSGRASTLVFQLNTGELVTAGADHRLWVAGGERPRPYLHVRSGLEALIARPVYYELAERAIDQGGARAGLWSDGIFFALEGADANVRAEPPAPAATR